MLIKRPVVVLFLAVLLCFLAAVSWIPDRMVQKYAVLDSSLADTDTVEGSIQGTVVKETYSGTTYRILIKDVQIILEDAEVFTSNLMVYSDKEAGCLAGDSLYAKGTISEFASPENPGQFSLKKYYLSQNVYYCCRADVIHIDKTHGKYEEYLEGCKRRLELVYDNHLSDKDAGVVKSMVLGEQGELNEDIRSMYQSTGISHILAISGLHISVIGLFIYGILKRLWLPRTAATAMAIFALYSYMLMTGAGVATKRAVIMMCMFFISRIVGRTYDLVSALAFSAFLLFLQTPYVIFQPGFLLSFGAILGASVLTPSLQSALGTGKNTGSKTGDTHQDTLSGNFLPAGYAIHAGRYIKEYCVNMLLGSLGIQLMILPVLAFSYYEVPLYGVFLNLLVLPFMGLLLVAAVVGGVLGCLYLPLGGMMEVPVHIILLWYEKAASFFLSLPGNLLVTGQPAPWQIAVYYGALCLFVGTVNKQRLSTKKAWAAGSACKGSMRASLLFLLPLCFIFLPWHYRGLKVTFLSVGQGDGIVMRSESGTVYMIDGGSSSESSLEKYCLTPYLLSQGISCVDYAIVTHPDMDHISGLMDIIGKSDRGGVQIKTLVLPEISFQDTAYEQLELLAKEQGVEISYIQKGDSIIDGRLSLTCLHPEKNMITEDRNAYSATLRLCYGEVFMLFTGDLPSEEEAGVMEEWVRLAEGGQNRCNVLKVAHHGSKYSSSEEFLACIRPELSVISCGRKNRYGHPHREVLLRLRKAGSVIAATPDYGAITVYTDGKTLRVETFR